MTTILELNGKRVDLNACSREQLIEIIKYLAKYANIPNQRQKKRFGNIEQNFLEEQIKFDNEECEERWYQHMGY